MSTMLTSQQRSREVRPDSRGRALVLRSLGDGRLFAQRDAEQCAVSVRRCFPWSEPGRFISLRDKDDKEFALVSDLSELDAGSRRALEAALAEAGLVLEIVRILRIEEEVEIRDWRVETRQGPRAFQTRLDDWPRQIPGGGVLIRDVAGDLYRVNDPATLDKRSRDLLWVFAD